MTLEIEEELTELERSVVDTIRDEDLHTYADIAEEIGVASNEVFDCLQKLIIRGLIVRRNGPPNEYYIPGTEPAPGAPLEGNKKTEFPNLRGQYKKNESPQKTVEPRMPVHHAAKIDLDVIEELTADGAFQKDIAAKLGLTAPTFSRLLNADDDLGAEIRAAVRRGSLKIARENVLDDDEEILEVGGPDQATVDDQEPEGGIGASEEPVTTESHCEPKVVESSNGFAETSQKSPTFSEYDPPNPLPRVDKAVGLTNDGIVSVVVYCDLFKATPVERDLIEGIIQLVQAFEAKEGL